MNTTRNGFLTASGAATTGGLAHAQDDGHDHGHQTVPSDLTLRVKALEWEIAFERQSRLVAAGKSYAQAKTIAEWALIDAPPGADNDVHGTNSEEAKDVGSLYNRLVATLNAIA